MKRNAEPAVKSTPPPAQRLSSVTSALRLVKAFTQEQPTLGITALAKQLGLAKSTVHRLATTLVAEGFLEQDPKDGQYRLGLLLFTLGTGVRRSLNVSIQAKAVLDRLKEKTTENIHLSVLADLDIVYLFTLESSHAIGIRNYLGMRRPAHCTAEGRAILAFAPSHALQRITQGGLKAKTPKTITQTQAWLAHLESIRLAGYAMDEGECDEELRTVAAPVFDAQGSVIAAVSLAGPSSRLNKKTMRQLVPPVVEASRVVSQRMGWDPGDS
jgi:IclR family transcriptional regulator, KDG regulon repressor